MSIQQLNEDLQGITKAAREPGALATSEGIGKFLQESLLPWLESQLEEIDGIDESLEDVIARSVDVLHPSSSAMLLALIEGASLLIGELKTRAATDQRIQKAIREWVVLARDARAHIEEVTVSGEDDPEEDDEEEAAPSADAPPIVASETTP